MVAVILGSVIRFFVSRDRATLVFDTRVNVSHGSATPVNVSRASAILDNAILAPVILGDAALNTKDLKPFRGFVWLGSMPIFVLRLTKNGAGIKPAPFCFIKAVS